MVAVIAIDPGPHTGVAVFDDMRRLAAHFTIHRLDMSSQYAEIAGQLANYASLKPVVVIESYNTVMMLSADGVTTIKLIGWVEGQAYERGLRVVFQTPAMKRAFLLEASQRLREGKHHSVGDHERDAVAHALCYMSRTGT